MGTKKIKIANDIVTIFESVREHGDQQNTFDFLPAVKNPL